MDNLRDPVTAPDDGPPTAEDLFADFIEGADEGRVVFEDFVALHPEHADALTRMHRRFHAMSTAFSVVAVAIAAPSAALRVPELSTSRYSLIVVPPSGVSSPVKPFPEMSRNF